MAKLPILPSGIETVQVMQETPLDMGELSLELLLSQGNKQIDRPFEDYGSTKPVEVEDLEGVIRKSVARNKKEFDIFKDRILSMHTPLGQDLVAGWARDHELRPQKEAIEYPEGPSRSAIVGYYVGATIGRAYKVFNSYKNNPTNKSKSGEGSR